MVTLIEGRGGGYGKECDVWSCGVIMYILLSGRMPFKEDKEALTLKKVKEGKYTWKGFGGVSKDAKDLIEKLLTVAVHKRCTLDQALSHTWIAHTAPNASQEAFARHSAEVVRNLQKFTRENQLKKAALQLVARQVDERTMEGLRSVFEEFDTERNGTLSVQELNAGLAKAGLTDVHQLTALAEALDSDHSGKIDYTEFIAATLDHRQASQEAACWAAFRVFDKNNDGKISKQELDEVLASRDVRGALGADVIKGIMEEVDSNNDGFIDFDEFMDMMRK